MTASALVRNLFSGRYDLPDEAALRRDQGCWLLVMVSLTLVPHWIRAPAWIVGFCIVLLVWRGLRLWRGQQAPPRCVLLPLAIGAFFGTWTSFGSIAGKTAGLALLSILLTLKLLETRNMRDIRVIVLLTLFMQFGLFLNDQSLPSAAFALAGTIIALGSLVTLSDPASKLPERLRMSGLLVLQGLPFMLVFFVLFPRAVSPLWGIPQDNAATTGLSDSMAPGTISEMILSDERAFTARFEGSLPPPALRATGAARYSLRSTDKAGE